jgi:hypothetical protein
MSVTPSPSSFGASSLALDNFPLTWQKSCRRYVDGVPAPIRGRVFFFAAAVLRVAFCFIAAMAVASSGDALAQTQPQAASPQSSARKLPPVKQMALTEKQIQGAIAASKDIHAITDSAPEDVDKLSAKTEALLDVVARKNGLASYDEYKSISENAGLVFGGYDPVTRKYVGKEALIKLRIARVRADKKMPAEDKKEALQDLNDDLQFPLPLVENMGNIALVVKYLDRLSAAMRGD